MQYQAILALNINNLANLTVSEFGTKHFDKRYRNFDYRYQFRENFKVDIHILCLGNIKSIVSLYLNQGIKLWI